MSTDKLKKYFEANLLDGDEIQPGQTLQAQEVFDFIVEEREILLNAFAPVGYGIKENVTDSKDDEKLRNKLSIMMYSRRYDGLPSSPAKSRIDGFMQLIKARDEQVARDAQIEENKYWLTVLTPAMDENVVYNSDLHSRIGELENLKKELR